MKKTIILAIILAISITGCVFKPNKSTILKPEEASAAALSFVKESLVTPGTEVTIKGIVEQNNLYKLTFVFPDGQEIDGFLSLDGKMFFPQALNIEEIKAEAQAGQSQQQPVPPVDVNKSDKPMVELFVMSHCPYGTQIEKGILPVLNLLGDNIDFELKFCDYAMHGETELNEELRQFCIQQHEPGKLLSYLSCFLGSSEGEACLATAGINSEAINGCISLTDSQYQVTAGFNDQSTWKGNYPGFAVYAAENQQYGVQGSPTLVINQSQVASSRDPQSLLNTICSAFNNPPAECQEQLSSTTPAPGFGYEGTGTDANASCE